MPHYTEAPEVRQLAGQLMEFHPHLRELGIRVEFLYRDDTPKKGGMEVWGKASKVSQSSFTAYYAQPDKKYKDPIAVAAAETDDDAPDAFFIIVMSKPIWEHLDDAAKLALTDHELCHCRASYDQNGVLRLDIRPHDFEDFHEIYERHGLWQPAAKRLLAAIFKHAEANAAMRDQLSLFEQTGAAMDNGHQDAQDGHHGPLTDPAELARGITGTGDVPAGASSLRIDVTPGGVHVMPMPPAYNGNNGHHGGNNGHHNGHGKKKGDKGDRAKKDKAAREAEKALPRS